MSQEPDAEDVKPKLNLIINYEGQHITVKVKQNMPFRKIFEAAEKRFGKESGRSTSPIQHALIPTIHGQERSALSTMETD
ncbi:hypothetical protein J3R82DRAFT_7579 [Butyriboletus roseoflavus]|nr:hypothetical protein J3R82DRAFT_7579 [Butyriboletus roseoflavus]